jgi:hypothetical protein
MFKFFLLILQFSNIIFMSIFDLCILYFQSDDILFALLVIKYVSSTCDGIHLAIIPVNILYTVDIKVTGRLVFGS